MDKSVDPGWIIGYTKQVPGSILYFPIAHNTLCLPPQILHKPLFLNAPGSIAFSQEHFKTISYAKFGGQTECIMGNWKIVNWGRAPRLALQCKNACHNTLKSEDLLVNKCANHNMISYSA